MDVPDAQPEQEIVGVPAIEPALVTSLEQATNQLAASLKSSGKEVASLRSALIEATKPRKLRSIGSVKRVVLYETYVKLQGQVVPLSPDVRASSSTMGTVHTRALRADEDRRELTLTLDWPGGTQAVHWERNNKSAFGALVTPQEVHKMAGAINTAAAQSHTVRARLETARSAHQRSLSEDSERATVSLVAAQHRQRELRSAVLAELAQLTPELEGSLPRSARSSVKAARRAVAAADDVDRKVGALLESLQSGPADGAVAPAEGVLALEGSNDDETGLLTARTEAPPIEDLAARTESEPLSDIELLERLARLHEQGILSPKEFSAKKAEILDRL
jgi:hypothetical protein